MPNYEFIGKSRLTSGFSYPLKRSVLDAFLDDQGISVVTSVAYNDASDTRRVLSADYYGPGTPMAYRLSLWVNAVPSNIRQCVAERIENELLSQLGDWMRPFSDRSKLASQLDHRFEVYYDDVSDDGKCSLDVRVDVPRKQRLLPRFRGKIRP